eukprot:9499214-Pyramimonas_sp.AAC.2
MCNSRQGSRCVHVGHKPGQPVCTRGAYAGQKMCMHTRGLPYRGVLSKGGVSPFVTILRDPPCPPWLIVD